MERSLLYIVNPISGTQNKQSLRELIEEKTGAAGHNFAIFSSVASGNYSYLNEEIVRRNVTDIIIAGGDGTVNQAIGSLSKHRLPFGIIPCGSGNGLAFSARIPKNPLKALEVIFTGKPAWTDAFLLNGQLACMLCGLGFDAQVAHDFANDERRGMATYIKKIVQNFFVTKTYPFVLQFERKKLEVDAYFISIANSNQFGNNFTIAPQASLTDGLLDIVIMTRQNKLSVLVQTLRQVTGFNQLQEVEMINDQTSVVYFQTKKIKIYNPESAPLHLDGEPVASQNKISISVLPDYFQLIYP